jgi:hypothetical protein
MGEKEITKRMKIIGQLTSVKDVENSVMFYSSKSTLYEVVMVHVGLLDGTVHISTNTFSRTRVSQFVYFNRIFRISAKVNS